MFGFVRLYVFGRPSSSFSARRFAVLVGPIAHLKHLVSKERLPFSAAYIASLVLTIYFSVSVSSTSQPCVFPQNLTWYSRSNRTWAP